MRKLQKFAVLVAMSGAMFAGWGGCSGFWNNVWKGFGYSIGGIPAGFVTNAVATFLAGLGITTT